MTAEFTELREAGAEQRPTNGPDIIYLEPGSDWPRDEGRLWCEDDDPDGQGPWLAYARIDIVASLFALLDKRTKALEDIKADRSLQMPDGTLRPSALKMQMLAHRALRSRKPLEPKP